MKTFNLKCPDCGRQIMVGVAEKDDPVNGSKFDTVWIEEAEDIPLKKK